MDFYQSFNYLGNHPIFKDRFLECLDIEVVKVDPTTLCIEDDTSRNTLTQVWLEAGPKLKEGLSHDIDLDCGGNTFEEAIIELAKLVKKEYGDDAEVALAKARDKFWDY